MKKNNIDWCLLSQMIIGCIFFSVTAILAYNDPFLKEMEKIPIYLFLIIWFIMLIFSLKYIKVNYKKDYTAEEMYDKTDSNYNTAEL